MCIMRGSCCIFTFRTRYTARWRQRQKWNDSTPMRHPELKNANFLKIGHTVCLAQILAPTAGSVFTILYDRLKHSGQVEKPSSSSTSSRLAPGNNSNHRRSLLAVFVSPDTGMLALFSGQCSHFKQPHHHDPNTHTH